MAHCEVPSELPVQLPEEDNQGFFYCPVKVSKGIKIGYADPTFVKCDHLAECKALHASVFNHSQSKKNTNFRAYPDRTASEPRIDGIAVVNHRKAYPKDYSLVIAKRTREEGS